jgi:hypothetical protein
MNRAVAIAVLVVVVSLGCDGSSAIQMTGDAAVDAADAATEPIAACVTLTVGFAGCDAERLAECEREYQSLPSAAQAAIDADGACFRNLGSTGGPTLNMTWPATPGTCAATLTVNEYWMHGACQGYNADVVGLITCGGTPVPCSELSSQTDCQIQQGCTWAAGGAGACAGTAETCDWAGGNYCTTQKGCASMSFSLCGHNGQTTCFFTGTLY